MTKPLTPGQHYSLAEASLGSAIEATSQELADYLVARAQVHATLACTTGAYADAYARWKWDEDAARARARLVEEGVVNE